jgi:hypothetical protein
VDSFSLGILAWRLHRYLSKQNPVPTIADLPAYHLYAWRLCGVVSSFAVVYSLYQLSGFFLSLFHSLSQSLVFCLTHSHTFSLFLSSCFHVFRFISTLPSRDLGTGMPPSLTEALPRLVLTDTSPAGAAAMGNNRMTVDDFLQAEFFRDVLIRTLRYLDSILEKDIEVCWPHVFDP